MKHGIRLLFLCLLSLLGITRAQKFELGQQTQGYLNDKSVIIDYTIGNFYYKELLYTVKSGDYLFPLTLGYSVNGSKKDIYRE